MHAKSARNDLFAHDWCDFRQPLMKSIITPMSPLPERSRCGVVMLEQLLHTMIVVMLDASVFDDLSRRLGALLPPGLADAKADFERNARAAVQRALGNLDLVTREEFDVQTAVLARTRSRLEALEERLAVLENETAEK